MTNRVKINKKIPYLLDMSRDMGFWFDEIFGIEQNEEFYNSVKFLLNLRRAKNGN